MNWDSTRYDFGVGYKGDPNDPIELKKIQDEIDESVIIPNPLPTEVKET